MIGLAMMCFNTNLETMIPFLPFTGSNKRIFL